MTVRRQIAEGAARVGVGAGLRWIQRLRRRGGAFIVAYHRVSDVPSAFGLTVPPELFDRQLSLLQRFATIVPLGTLVERLECGDRLEESLVAITFDDGYLDNLEIAEPILRHHKAPATIFVTVEFADGTAQPYWDRLESALAALGGAGSDRKLDLASARLSLADAVLNAISASDPGAAVEALELALRALPRGERDAVLEVLERPAGLPVAGERFMLSWPEIRALADRGLEIGCHTWSHPALSLLTGDELSRELGESKRMIEEKLGRPVRGLAYPFGDYSIQAREAARAAGFDYACTMIEGANAPGDDPLQLRRIDCGGQTPTLLDLRLALRGLWSPPVAPRGLGVAAAVGG